MTVSSAAVSVATTATALHAADADASGIEVQNVVVDELTIEDRLVALEAKTADLPDKAQGRG